MRYKNKLLIRASLLTKVKIEQAFAQLDVLLKEPVDLVVVGGAVMVLKYGRQSTKDVDAVSNIKPLVPYISTVGHDLAIDSDWLNAALEHFDTVPEDRQEELWRGSNLTVYGPDAELMLIMKMHSAGDRFNKDEDDVELMVRYLNLSLSDVERLYREYFNEPVPQNVYYQLKYHGIR